MFQLCGLAFYVSLIFSNLYFQPVSTDFMTANLLLLKQELDFYTLGSFMCQWGYSSFSFDSSEHLFF